MTAPVIERRATEVAALHAEGVAGINRVIEATRADAQRLQAHIERTTNAAGWDDATIVIEPATQRRTDAQRRLYRITKGRHPSDWWLLGLAAILAFAGWMGWLTH